MAKKTRQANTSDDPATAYAQKVVAGEIVAGPHVRASCQRHLRDIEEAGQRGLVWDKKAAARALGFFPDVLRLSGGQKYDGKPFVLHPSQEFIIGSIFGWKKDDGARRFRRAYLEIGKGNGKTPLAAGIGLYGLVADREPQAEIYAAAAKQDQAMIMFRDAVSMVRQSPALQGVLTMSGVNPVHNLAYIQQGSFFRPLGRDTGKTGSGLRPHFALIDEIHEHPNGDTVDILERGFKWREQPLLFMITNSGSDRTSICWHEREWAVKAAHGEGGDNADGTFSFVCSLDDGDDPLEDPTCWIKANPLIGELISYDEMKRNASQARDQPSKANYIRRLHFCEWTDSETAWLDRKAWERCEDPDLRLEDFEGEECWIGLDLSAARDMTAYALLFRDGYAHDGKPKFALFGHAYLPGDTIPNRVRDGQLNEDVPQWIENGWVTALPGKLVHHGAVARDIVQLGDRFVITQLSYDRYLYDRFEEALNDIGAALPVVEHPQTYNKRRDTALWMPQSVNDFEEVIIEGRLRVEPNPAMRAAVMGAMIEESPAGLRKFAKQTCSRSGIQIDLAIAATMAVGSAVVGEPEPDFEPRIRFA